MDNLKLRIAQLDLVWEDVNANLRQVEKELASDEKVDLLVLPEMFLTGFSMRVEQFALVERSNEFLALIQFSKTYQTAIMGSLMFKNTEGAFVNRMLLIDGDQVQHYDKIHLFSPGRESAFYQAGDQIKIFEFRSWKIKPQICYDLRFPVESFNFEDYDLLVYVANWPLPRIHAWSQLLKARAIENQAFVIGCNRVGKDGNGWSFNGQSTVINPMGETCADLGDKKRSEIRVLKKSDLQKVRDEIPFLRDRTNII